MTLDTFVNQYLETALWSEIDDSDPDTGGEPLDENYSIDDFAPGALAQATRDCAAFMSTWRSEIDSNPGLSFPHDFWLTRNHHGAGFWDGDYPEPLGDRLTDAAHAFGECDVYVGDDGLLYIS